VENYKIIITQYNNRSANLETYVGSNNALPYAFPSLFLREYRVFFINLSYLIIEEVLYILSMSL